MSESSENDSSEEFYDAEDLSANPHRKRNSKSGTPQTSTESGSKDGEFKFPEPLPPPVLSTRESQKVIRNVAETRSLSPEDAAQQLRNFKMDSISEGRRIGGPGPPTVLEVKSSVGFGRQRFRDLRRCMQYDDDENPGHVLTPDSQNSSVEGIFPQQKSHPFRIIEKDAMSVQSMVSLGKVGRILSGSIDPSELSGGKEQQQQQQQQNIQGSSSGTVSSSSSSTATSLPLNPGSTSTLHHVSSSSSSRSSPPVRSAVDSGGGSDKLSLNSVRTENSNSGTKVIFHEPDVIASTKLASSKTTDSLVQAQNIAMAAGFEQSVSPGLEQPVPVAPPRRRKKGGRKTSTSSSDQVNMNIGLSLPPTDKMTMSSGTGGDTSSVSSDRAGSVGSGISVPPSAGVSNYSGAIQRPTDLPLRHSTNDSISNSSRGIGVGSGIADALSRHSGNSSSSVNSTKPPTSPSNSGKSNTLPGRGSSSSSHFDPSSQQEGGGMQLYKVIRGNTTSSQPGSTVSGAQDQLEHLDRFDRIRAEIMSGGNMNVHSASIGGMSVQRGASVGGGGRGHGGTTMGVSGAPAGTGSNSLGSATKYAANLESHMANVEKRRRSAGDEDLMKQMNVYLRTRTGSGKNLTDLEILSQVPVKNLDTGENFPLSAVEENIPGGTDLNPLSLHILRLTSHLEIRESDDESVCGSSVRGGGGAGSESTIPTLDDDEGEVEEGGRLRRKTAKLRRFFGSTVRKTVDKAKSIASEVSHARHKEDVADIVDAMNPEQNIKIKASSSNKGPYEFTKLQHVQDLGEAGGGAGTSSSGACGPDGSQSGTGAVWCMKFSSCGRLLATAGQDKVLKIWVLKDAYPFFQDMRTKYNAEQKASPTPSQESLVSHNSAEEALAMAAAAESCPGPFMPRAFCSYTGHTSDLLDVAWSKNYFILSSSMDKTVRLWHISRRECLCSFQHIDFVTAIAFHPRDDRFFLSGSLDGKLRLWNIPDKKVALYTELNGPTKLITAANFCQNGKFAVVGSYDGRCIFYTTDQLRYHTMVHVRSSRGRNKTARKISGIEPMPGEDKILVTSNDSRVRLYDLRDLNLSCKYKGFVNASSQIKASFSHDGKYIIAGSENQCIYVWKTHNDQSKLGSGLRRDRSDYWEGIKAHNATVTCAIFAPHPEAIIKPEMDNEITDTTSQKSSVPPDPMVEQHKKGCGYVMVSADYNGAIKVFIKKTKPKHSSLPYTAILD